MLIQIKIAILVILLAASNLGTWRYMDNKAKADKLKHSQALIVKDNEAKALIAAYNIYMDDVKEEARTNAAKIKPLIITNDCSALLTDTDRLRDELIDSIPKVLIHHSK